MNIHNPDNQKAGEARSPGPSTADIIGRDTVDAPHVLPGTQYEFLGDDDLPYATYTPLDVFDAEVENRLPKVWQWACRMDHTTEVGDQYCDD